MRVYFLSFYSPCFTTCIHVTYIYIFRLSRFCLLFSLGVVTIYNRFNLWISSIKIFNWLNCYLSFFLSSCKFFFCVCVCVLCYFVPGWHSVSKCWIDLCLPPKRFCVLSERWDEHTNLFSFFLFFGGGGGGMFCVLIPSFAECIFHVLFCLSLLTCKHFCCCHVDCILILVTHAHKVLFVEM